MQATPPSTISTGVSGLDFILRGGFPQGTSCLLAGGTGTGKTTLALQFLLEGIRAGERTLFIALSQNAADLERVGHSHGWSLEDVDVYDATNLLVAELQARQRVIRKADVELSELGDAIRDLIKERAPDRLVLDAVSMIRALSGQQVSRYREELALLLQVAREHEATALFIDNEQGDLILPALANSVIVLSQDTSPYGTARRRLQVDKVRGIDCITGLHDFVIRTGGLEVFPRLQNARDSEAEAWQSVSSGSDELDALLGGGLQTGTACMLAGEAGTGKTTMASTYLHNTLANGEQAAVFLFDERPYSFFSRAESMNMGVRSYAESGQLHLQSIANGSLTAGEFGQLVRRLVDQGVRLLVIDSLTGYFHTMQQRDLLLTQLHEILEYTSSRGVLTLLVVAQHGMVGQISSPVDISYIADTVILLRNFEINGRVRKAISVLKKRHGDHERRIREFIIGGDGLRVGAPIQGLSNILGGNPRFTGDTEDLMGRGSEDAEAGDDA